MLRSEFLRGLAATPFLRAAPPSETAAVGPTICVVNHSTLVTDAEVERATAVVAKQVARDFTPAWGLVATLRASRAPASTDWPIYVADDSPRPLLFGGHDARPEGFVFLRENLRAKLDWRTALSHEALEMLADPWTALAYQTPRGFAVTEVCDPVQDDAYLLDGVPVSNFVLPSWYVDKGAPYDFLGLTRSAGELRPGGYLSYYQGDGWTQRYGPTRRAA